MTGVNRMPLTLLLLELTGKGKVDGHRSGDLGDFKIVAYSDPSSGPCVCCDESINKVILHDKNNFIIVFDTLY